MKACTPSCLAFRPQSLQRLRGEEREGEVIVPLAAFDLGHGMAFSHWDKASATDELSLQRLRILQTQEDILDNA
eukprot:CAMPEP_0172527888 /NCGR_PEP_ID=MMETSP1067-20121228/2442_1 /TAXON_ID=265564 ORGANISM="Thalassiosira punctigera, Strain Tpunct2005C2" /NCGR_SAMPLE_ID=MMETSP1067 /ASSEMBLY_ACC=CAM_ASM_000444 /LENGTH=73 /DNA_ID=CAMNT_0013311711 /DNA_START=123 /DNA_END=340 /DNA_ORIENTATION=+